MRDIANTTAETNVAFDAPCEGALYLYYNYGYWVLCQELNQEPALRQVDWHALCYHLATPLPDKVK
jgi:hypothetical protein